MNRRLTYSLLITLLLSIGVSAQQSGHKSDPTDLIVLSQSWHKDFIGSRTETNPLQPNEDLIRQTRAEKQFVRDREYELPNQTTAPRFPTPGPRPVPDGRINRDVYVYQLTVKNTGVKRIKSVEWEFQFLHPDTQEVMGSRRITSKVKLAPGKTEKIEARLLQQPTHLVLADQLDKKYRDQFKEQIIIHRIEYADHSVWQRQP